MHPRDLDDEERTFASDMGLSPGRGTCPDPALLNNEVRGVLPAEMADAIAAHVEACHRCRALTDDLNRLEPEGLTDIERTRIRARIERKTVRSRVHPPRWVGLAAALAVAASLVIVALWNQAPARPAIRAAGPLRSTATFARHVPSAETVLAARAPAVELPFATITRRGPGQRSAEAFMSGVRAYRNGAYAAAADSFAMAADANPSDAHAWFYLGVSRLLAGDAAAAIAPLQTATRVGAGAVAAEATWYLSLALQKAGRTASAIDQLAPLCGVPGPHAVDACAALEVLSRPSRSLR